MAPKKILIIGAGIMGVSVAYALHRRGASVVLIDPDGVARKTTGTSYGWINSHKKLPDSYHALNMEGLKYWREILAPQFPDAVTFNGHLVAANSESHIQSLAERVSRLRSLGYAVNELPRSDARKLVPFQLPRTGYFVHFPEEGHASPVSFARQLVDEMRKSNRFEFASEPVLTISANSPEVVLASGNVISGTDVLVAAGTNTSTLIRPTGIDLPMIPAEVNTAAFAYIAEVSAIKHDLRRLVTFDTLSFRPNGENSLLIQALDLDAEADPAQPPPAHVYDVFLERLYKFYPQVQLDDIEVRIGHRVIPADGYTVAGSANRQSDDYLWVATTHSGIVLGPWIGSVLADEIITGSSNALLSAFRPDRFQNCSQTYNYRAPRSPGDQ